MCYVTVLLKIDESSMRYETVEKKCMKRYRVKSKTDQEERNIKEKLGVSKAIQQTCNDMYVVVDRK